jgi:5'-nucleotidase
MKKTLISAAIMLSLSAPALAAISASVTNDALPASPPTPSIKIQDSPERPMRILIVNDDGCESAGTVSLKQKLEAKGYEAWIVAPATNQSGIGTAITFKPNKVFNIKKLGDRHYCFPGTPSDALDFGVVGILKDRKADLVISGVNDGPNTGMAQVNSGTVGAAVRAIRHGYPAIAASIGIIPSKEEMSKGFPSTLKYWPDSVDYVVSLVDRLAQQWQAGKRVLPVGTGLSINYPPIAKQEIKGVKYIINELTPTPQFYYQIQQDGNAVQVLMPGLFTPNNDDTDTGWLDKGYITYTVLDGNWNNPSAEPQYQALLADIKTKQNP